MLRVHVCLTIASSFYTNFVLFNVDVMKKKRGPPAATFAVVDRATDGRRLHHVKKTRTYLVYTAIFSFTMRVLPLNVLYLNSTACHL